MRPFVPLLASCLAPACAFAQSAGEGAAVTLPDVVVSAPATNGSTATGIGGTAPPTSQRYQLPQTSASITAKGIEETINAIDSEDAIKYFPSLFVRKRNEGDTQPVLATRTSGVNQSARTLVYADDVLISALIANNNTIGAPRWGLVAPSEIQRVDFLYGPFAAQYPGNSVGGVLLITTQMPTKREIVAKQVEAFQTFDLYGTNRMLRTDQTFGSIGDRVEYLSWFMSVSHLNSYSQPLFEVTSAGTPAGTNGTIPAFNKLGAAANVVGAGALQHQQIDNAKFKVAYDFSPWMQGTYTFGFYSNETTGNDQSYLATASGAPTFGGVSSFAADQYTYDEKHMANSVKLATDTHGKFDIEIVASNYAFLNDIQRSPYTVASTGAAFSTNGKVASMNGTNWTNADIKAIWRPFGSNGSHEISFGLHGDQYDLHNPTYAAPIWYSSIPDGQLYTSGSGTTNTGALWVQDAWRVLPSVKLTTGLRAESWEAVNGVNIANTASSAGAITAVLPPTMQPTERAVRVSPKATVEYEPNKDWLVKVSFGEANRFPTVSELYQIVSSGGTNQNPNPNLRPEQAFSEELALMRKWHDGDARLSLFQENDNSALVSQTAFPANGGTPTTFFTNVDETRLRGVELALRQGNIVWHGLELSGNTTYVDSRILADSRFVSTIGTTAVGKRVPYIPDWRATIATTYRPNDRWAFTVAARYSGKQYSTVDNTDTTSNVFGAFDRFVVVDTRIHYAASATTSFDVGIDNLNNEKYFLYHPFPERTFYADARLTF